MSEPKPDVPIFDIQRHFDALITIADQRLPVRVQRLTRTAWLEFKKQWDALMEQPRGDAALTPEQRAAREAQQLAFMEQTITDYITLDEGYVRVDGAWVTTGSGLIDAFHTRVDVLTDLVAAVFIQNTLMPLFRKNLSSPRASVTGLDPSIPARGGDEQGPTVDNAAPSSSVASAPVTEAPAPAAGSPSSSGATRTSEEPIVH